MHEAIEPVKYAEMVSLCEGDRFLSKSGKVFTFMCKKAKYIAAVHEGRLFNVIPSNFERLIERAPKGDMWYNALKENDFFYVQQGLKCLAFQFVRKENHKIIAKNLITKTSSTIRLPISGAKICGGNQ